MEALNTLEDLTQDPNNANIGTERGAALLETSLAKHGAGRSILADENGFSAMYANGVWRYQKFHVLPEIHQLARSYFGREYRVYTDDGKPALNLVNSTGWGVVAVKRRILALESIEGALSREFDLPLPDGQSFGRSADILQAWRKAKGARA